MNQFLFDFIFYVFRFSCSPVYSCFRGFKQLHSDKTTSKTRDSSPCLVSVGLVDNQPQVRPGLVLWVHQVFRSVSFRSWSFRTNLMSELSRKRNYHPTTDPFRQRNFYVCETYPSAKLFICESFSFAELVRLRNFSFWETFPSAELFRLQNFSVCRNFNNAKS